MRVAFGAAILIHITAAALATSRPQVREIPPGDGAFPPVTLDPVEPPSDEPPPPTPDITDPPPIPNDESIWEDRSTPPLIRRKKTPAMPIPKPGNPANPGSQSFDVNRVSALIAPRLEYPYEARRQKIMGTGVAVMTIDFGSGRVTDSVMELSTGSLILDNAAISGFRRWRFKPGTITKVRMPITFTLTGVRY